MTWARMTRGVALAMAGLVALGACGGDDKSSSPAAATEDLADLADDGFTAADQTAADVDACALVTLDDVNGAIGGGMVVTDDKTPGSCAYGPADPLDATGIVLVQTLKAEFAGNLEEFAKRSSAQADALLNSNAMAEGDVLEMEELLQAEGGNATAVGGFGDEAFTTTSAAGTSLLVRWGDVVVIFTVTGQVNGDPLEIEKTLARAADGRI